MILFTLEPPVGEISGGAERLLNGLKHNQTILFINFSKGLTVFSIILRTPQALNYHCTVELRGEK